MTEKNLDPKVEAADDAAKLDAGAPVELSDHDLDDTSGAGYPPNAKNTTTNGGKG